nr:hypothetical protein [Tanacetum cinerariifolium]
MPPLMTSRNTGQQTVASRGGRTSEQTGRRGGRTGEQIEKGGGRTGDQGGRGNGSNGGVDEVPEFSTVIAQQSQDLLPITPPDGTWTEYVSEGVTP